MSYEIQFQVASGADWAQAIELIDNQSNAPLADAADAVFELEVIDGSRPVLRASTEDDSVEKPADNVIQWRFPASRMRGLRAGETYRVACTMATEAGKIVLFTGTLALVKGMAR